MAQAIQPDDDPGLTSLTATSRAIIKERLATIERAVLSARPEATDDLLRNDARHEAHKLAGSLDIFGLTHAADIAGELEQIFRSRGAQAVRARELMVNLRREIDDAFRRVDSRVDAVDTLSTQPSTTASARILLADDDDIMARMIESALRRQGYDVVRARDGAESVALATGLPFDLVLMDLQMPVMDGFSACLALRRIPRLTDVPIVLLTAQSNVQHVRERSVGGVTDYLIKPFGVAELRARVRDWLSSTSDLHR